MAPPARRERHQRVAMQATSEAGPGVAQLEAAFSGAEATAPVEKRSFRIGGHQLMLRFAGQGVIPSIVPAFAHLEAAPFQEPELIVDIGDGSSTGAAPPVPPDVDPESPVGALYFFEDPPVRGVFRPGIQALSVVDLRADHAWCWVADPDALPYWERAAPIRQILHWWMATRGHQQVHGGAIGTPDGGVLLAGKGGSGKSTCSLVSLMSELRYAGDDYTMVSLEPHPLVHSLFCSGKVHPENLWRVPHLAAAVSNAQYLAVEKAVVFVDQQFPDRLIDSFPLRAIVLPTITGSPCTRAVPTSRAAALAALAPSTVFQLHTAGSEALRYMARLVREVPAFVLELGHDVSEVPNVILALLDDLGPVAP
jgi:hypothetical protein